MIDIVLIPDERKSVLIGKDGSVKRAIEKKTKTTLRIGNGVEIEGQPLDVLKTKDIVRAIGRGFSPKKAFLLLDDDIEFILITIEGETANTLKRISARIIGRKGFTKRKIEEETGTHLSVYGKTIGIIGRVGHAEKARRSVEQLIEGKSHRHVYAMLKK